MGIQRIFLGWQQAGLQAAAEWLVGRYRQGPLVALDQAIVVLPGGRAGRRLLEILVERCEGAGWQLVPPQITTVGRLPELLYPQQRPFADELTQQLAWVRALRSIERSAVAEIIPQLPDERETVAWLELGRVLQAQHRELASDVLDFADVIERGRQLETFNEERRWEILAQVQRRYLELLDGLDLWDRQTARRVAIQKRECHTERDLVLVGTVDLNQAARQMLDQVSDRTTSLVFAPLEFADAFDGHGCLEPEAWQQMPIPVRDEQLRVVDGPADQARAVVEALAEYEGAYRADEIVVGVPDERLISQLERRLNLAGVRTRWGVGRSLQETGPFRLLEHVADYLDGRAYRELAALVRHADLFRWLDRRSGAPGQWLEQLDEYYNQHLPRRLGDKWLGTPAQYSGLRRVHQLLEELLAEFSETVRPLGEWTEPLVALLLAVYDELPLDREDMYQRGILQACEQLYGTLLAHEAIPRELMPSVSASEAIHLALQQAQGATVPTATDADALELLGWLELPLDDAPALVVTSVNEGFVPKSINADLFLPNNLRSRLQLEDNVRRYARDAYALSVLLASRERLTLIVGRRDQEAAPLAPSRLLFAADPQTVARRALLFFEEREQQAAIEEDDSVVPASNGRRVWVPRPRPLCEPIRHLSVTAFRNYLACPYRFYLASVLRLESVDDGAEELDGGAFGDLLHDVLNRFGRGELRDSCDAKQIAAQLQHELNQCVQEKLGDSWLPSVGVQLEQLRVRLDAFATAQAAWASHGWRIEHVEVSPSPDAPAELIVDGAPLALRGRIDRIDVHQATGERVILDYKSSDAGKAPDKTHRRQGKWVDLQLPLYRHLVRCLGIDSPVQLGYVLLPKDAPQASFCLAEWTEAELQEADEVACEVVRRLRCETFWPMTDPAPDYSHTWAAICQDGVFERVFEPELTK